MREACETAAQMVEHSQILCDVLSRPGSEGGMDWPKARREIEAKAPRAVARSSKPFFDRVSSTVDSRRSIQRLPAALALAAAAQPHG